ncbi:MAG: hypothetical protein AAGH76_02230 [Pseudomonadota bacterium]
MSDTKELTWGDATRDDESGFESADDAAPRDWDACSNWLSRAPAPATSARIATDASVYTWKGYRNWSDKVKRNWSDRKDTDKP